MRHRTGLRIARLALVIVAASAFAFVVLAAQDRFTLKSATASPFRSSKAMSQIDTIVQ
jgi:hypothetical protein